MVKKNKTEKAKEPVTFSVETTFVPFNQIVVDEKNNSRLDLNVPSAELIHSIKEHGLLSPVGVTRSEDGTHTLAYGFRRMAALKSIGLTDHPIPVVIVHTNPDLANLAENAARKDLTPWEEASAFAALKAKGVSAEELSSATGRSISHVNNLVRLHENLVPSLHEKVVKMGADAPTKSLLLLAGYPTDQQEAIWNETIACGKQVKAQGERKEKKGEDGSGPNVSTQNAPTVDPATLEESEGNGTWTDEENPFNEWRNRLDIAAAKGQISGDYLAGALDALAWVESGVFELPSAEG